MFRQRVPPGWRISPAARRHQRKLFGDRVEQRLKPDLFGLAEVMQDIAVHEVLVARMPDAEPDAPVVLADMIVDRAQPLCPPWPPPCLTLTLPGARSRSSWITMTLGGASLKNRMASPTDWPERS
jgi:hypothetical protein